MYKNCSKFHKKQVDGYLLKSYSTK